MKEIKIKDLEEYLEEQELELDYSIFEEDHEHRIMLETGHVLIKELNIKIFSGFYETYSEDSEDFEMDFDFYMFFDSETSIHLYEEQGSSLEVCIYNYCRTLDSKMDLEDIESLECEFIIEGMD